MKIMITGGTGFIASHLVDNLIREKQHEIVLLARSKNKIENVQQNLNEITIDYVDVTDFSTLKKKLEKDKPEVIFHLAGETSHKQSFDNPMYDADVNLKSTICILETIKNFNSNCKFILGSTFIVVGKPEKLPVDEESKCNPTTIYGTNRLASEQFCKIYHNMYDLDIISFRITNSFGPREQYLTPSKNAINHLIYKAHCEEEVNIYNQGKFFRDIIYVDDVISGLKTILQKGKPGNLYWISSGKKTWFYEIGNWLSQLTKATINYVDAPSYTKKVDVGNFVADNSKLKSLGWSPRISVRNGIEKTLEYFKTLDKD